MYSQDAKDMSIRAYLKLRSLRRASALLGISKSTLHRWIGNHPIARRQRDARKATHQALQLIETILSNNPFEKPALISAIIHNALGVSLGASTVRFWMKRRGMTYKKATRLTSTDTEATRVLRLPEGIYKSGGRSYPGQELTRRVSLELTEAAPGLAGIELVDEGVSHS